jgi:hypothetical protein
MSCTPAAAILDRAAGSGWRPDDHRRWPHNPDPARMVARDPDPSCCCACQEPKP